MKAAAPRVPGRATSGRRGNRARIVLPERNPATCPVALLLMVALACWPALVRAGDLDSAVELANEGRLSEAQQVIAPLLEENSDNFRARLLQGILQVRAGRLGDAARVFAALRDTYPDRSEPYNNLAAVYVAQGRLDDAHAALLAAIAREPDLPVAHENLADLYIRLARRSSGRAREAARAPPSDRDAVPAAPLGDSAVGAEVPDPPPVATAPAVRISEDTRACMRATGFADAAVATEAVAWLEGRGATVEMRQDRYEVVKEHWVFHRPLPSRAEAVAKMEEMRGRGVEDIAVIRHGDLVNAISLGIYRSTDNLKRRVAALEDMGYPVQYETTLETVTRFGMDAELAVLPAFLHADWQARFPGHPLEASGCD